MAGRSKPQARRQNSTGTPAWAWLLIGLFIGALAYFGYQQYQSMHTTKIDALPIPNKTPKSKDVANASEPPASGMDDSVLDTDYSFYDVLPSQETVDVPVDEVTPEQTPVAETLPKEVIAPKTAVTAVEPKEITAPDASRYVLQAGAFERSADADDLKARIAMSGESARVEQAEVNGKTMYRVRLGPFDGAAATDRARANLAGQGIQANRIAVK
jgi:cell division protein FtsN